MHRYCKTASNNCEEEFVVWETALCYYAGTSMNTQVQVHQQHLSEREREMNVQERERGRASVLRQVESRTEVV